jgi:hypothetical protein
MKPALLNSIYEDDSKSLNSLHSLVSFYAKKIQILYLDLLDKSGIKNLDEKVKVITKFPDGHVLKNTYKAGHHFIEYLFEGPDFRKDIEKLDEMFLNNCRCENKEDILDWLKHYLIEEGSKTVSFKDWEKSLKDFKTCESFDQHLD